MNAVEFITLAALITASTICVDFAAARWSLAVRDGRRWAAGRWSVAQWAATSAGFVLVVKVNIWLLPFEAVGLFIGSVWGGKPRAVPRVISG